MLKQKAYKIKPDAVKWHRFSRKGYAVFASLGKEIIISTLSVATLAFVVPTTAQAQTSMNDELEVEKVESDTLPDLVVTATKLPMPLQQAARIVNVITEEQIQECPATTVNDLLKFTAEVDVRQRGAFGIQTDVSVNGGTHDQIVILLNGVNISSPQTGHLSADLPIDINDIQRIEILEGAASRVFGSSAFSGAVNIITKKNTTLQDNHHSLTTSLGIGAGSFGTVVSDMSMSLNSSHAFNHLSTSLKRSDGGTLNSQFEKYNFFYNGGVMFEKADVDWQFAISNMNYGANTFYSGKYPNQFEQNKRIIGAVVLNTKGLVSLKPTLYFNRNYDHYQLIRHSNFGENYHLTDVYGLDINSSWKWLSGTTVFGADFRNEGILSTALGKPLLEEQFVKINGKEGYYTKKDNRTNISFFLEQDWMWNRISLSAGLMANMNTSLDHLYRFYPGIDISYRPDSRWKFCASWNLAQRIPTFTDLYYKSPTQEGNTGIKPEKTSEFALDAMYKLGGLNVRMRGFYRHQKNMIDWILTEADSVNNFTTYHVTNFRVNNWGVSVNANLSFQRIGGKQTLLNYCSFAYAFIHQKRLDNIRVYAASYALDYLRHKLIVNLNANVLKNVSAELTCRIQDRMGEYVKYEVINDADANNVFNVTTSKYKPYALFNLKLLWKQQKFEVYAMADNLTGKRYFDIGNVPQPGLWIITGAKVTL